MKYLLFILMLLSIFWLSSPVFAEEGSTVGSQEVLVRGKDPFSLRTKGGKTVLVSEIHDLFIEHGDKTIVLRDGKSNIYASIRLGNEDILELLDSSNALRFLVVRRASSYSLLNQDKKLLYQTRVSEDRFSILTARSGPVISGNKKATGYSVEDQNGKDLIQLSGITSPWDASALALPIDVPYRALIYLSQKEGM